jgi:hypothetical protein
MTLMQESGLAALRLAGRAGIPVPRLVGDDDGTATGIPLVLTGLVDWDCAGAGAPGVDLGSLRCDAAICYGLSAPDHVLAGWEQAAGQAAEDVAYWDVVGALATPPDMG